MLLRKSWVGMLLLDPASEWQGHKADPTITTKPSAAAFDLQGKFRG
jgi:hypothetical protein